jgi:hypothetical protein
MNLADGPFFDFNPNLQLISVSILVNVAAIIVVQTAVDLLVSEAD